MKLSDFLIDVGVALGFWLLIPASLVVAFVPLSGARAVFAYSVMLYAAIVTLVFIFLGAICSLLKI